MSQWQNLHVSARASTRFPAQKGSHPFYAARWLEFLIGNIYLQDKKKEEKLDTISLEDLIEKERAALGSKLTKVTQTIKQTTAKNYFTPGYFGKLFVVEKT